MAKKNRPVRRTQAERTAATTKRLLEATLETICACGYAGATTGEIVRRAGVSRGAQVHHYPTRLDLIAAAVEYLDQKSVDGIERLWRESSGGAAHALRVLERVWEDYLQGPLWTVWLEVVVASRNDGELRQRLQPVARRFNDRVDAIIAGIGEELSSGDGQLVVLINMAVCTLRGLAFQSLMRTDRQYYDAVREALHQIVRDKLEPASGRRPALARDRRR